MSGILRSAVLAAGLVFSPVSAEANVVTDWDTAAIAVATPGPAGQREMAIVHAAMFDAVNAIEHRYRSYLVDMPAAKSASPEAAAAAAAASVLTELHPDAG